MYPVEKLIPDYDAMRRVGTDVYYGWCGFGCSGAADDKWMIVKHTIIGNNYVRLWANGLKEQNLIFNNCTDYDYSHLI